MTEPVDRRPSPETLDYEAARGELVETVRRLEAGAASLEESLALWERGEALADRCAAVLDGARARLDARVETVTAQDADGARDGARDGSGARSPQARGREDE